MDCCTIGKKADDAYTPKGTTIKLGRLNVYESKAPAGTASGRVLLLLPDGFGLVKHNFLLADSFATRGWRVLIPDYFEGNPLPIQHLRHNDPDLSEADKEILRTIDLDAWLNSHPHEHVDTLLRELIETLVAQGEGGVHVVGYCFGGKHALRMAGREAVAVASVASFHPYHVAPEDVENILCPAYIGLAELDHMVPETLKEDLERWTGLSKRSEEKDRVSLVVYPGVDHGFAARPDTEDAVVAAQYAKAFEDAVDFFSKS